MLARRLRAWAIPVASSTLLHLALAWGILAAVFAWAPRPPEVIPVSLLQEPEPVPSAPEAARPPLPQPNPVAIPGLAPPQTQAPPPREPAPPPDPVTEVKPPPVPALEAPEPTPKNPEPSPPKVETAAVMPPVPEASPDEPRDASGVEPPRPHGGSQVIVPYPPSARRLGIEGRAWLGVLVLADGRVGEVAIQRSAGDPDLDKAAANAVRRSRFDPARKGAEAVAMWVLLPVEFLLKD